MALESNYVIKQEVIFSGHDTMDYEDHSVDIYEGDGIFIKSEIENQDDDMEFEDTFALVKEEISREIDEISREVNEILDTHDKQLDMKGTVELHTGDIHGTSSYRKCRIIEETPFRTEKSLNLQFPYKSTNYLNVCRRCGATFRLKADKKKHMIEHKKFDMFEKYKKNCRVCSISFKSVKEYDEHYLSYILACCSCNLKFSSIQEKKRHMDSLHPKETFNCKICDKAFLTEISLQEHIEVVHSHKSNIGDKRKSSESAQNFKVVKKFKCELCHKCFCSYKNLCNHQRRIHDTQSNIIKPYSCDICTAKFATRILKQQHYVSFHCPLSNQEGDDLKNAFVKGKKKSTLAAEDSKDTSFSDQNSLGSHGNKPNGVGSICNICDRANGTNCNLGLHVPRLLKNEYLKCNICNSVVGKKNMAAHKSSKHGVKYVPCPICKITFEDGACMNDHVKENHDSNRHYCSMCDKVFGTAIELDGHVNWHNGERPYHCEHCNKSFGNLESLIYHSRNFHNAKTAHYCKSCDLKFPDFRFYKSHMETEHGNGDFNYIFECGICMEKFFMKELLDNHLLSVHFKESQPVKPTRKFLLVLPEKPAQPVSDEICKKFDNTFPCYICKVKCNRKNLLKDHLFSIHWESLSDYHKELMWKVKEKADKKNYKFVWYQNNQILVRKNSDDKAIAIRDENDMYKM